MSVKKQMPVAEPDDGNDTAMAPQKWLRHIFEHSPALVCITDFNGIFLDINEAGVRMLGGRFVDEFIGKISISNFYDDPDDNKRLQDIIGRDGFVQDYETRFRRQDASVIHVRITAAVRRNVHDEVAGYEGFIIDITDRKLAEQALRESEEKYRTVVESSLSAILIHQEGRFQFANRRCAEMVGLNDPSMLIGRNFWDFVHPKDRAIVKERGLMREKGQLAPEHYTFRVLENDGKTMRWVEIQATHAMYMGKPAAVANFIDITQSKQAEEEIRDLSRRLVKVREEERKMLAADLHDDFGQTLTAMHFDLETLQKAISPEAADKRERCERLIRNVERLAEMVRKTTSYLRPDIFDQMVLIPALTRYIEGFKSHQPDINVEFHHFGLKKRFQPEIELVIYRIFQECLINIAKHAHADRVEIILTYSHPRVILIVRDNGVGYGKAGRKSRTKKHAEGIGLVCMRERVVSLGGSLEVSSAPNKGTTIRADIPV